MKSCARQEVTRMEKCSINTTVIDVSVYSSLHRTEQLLHATPSPALEEVLPGYKGTRDKSLRCVGIVRFVVAL